MLETEVIDKKEVLPDAQNFGRLREAGVEHIQNLSGKIWTDHNLHDPGITSLEALAFALTDLGYRTSFEIRDLLTPESGIPDPPASSGLFPAHEVLTTNPLTIYDYRKLLLKIEGVRNAWLDPMMDPSKVRATTRSRRSPSTPTVSRTSFRSMHAECRRPGQSPGPSERSLQGAARAGNRRRARFTQREPA